MLYKITLYFLVLLCLSQHILLAQTNNKEGLISDKQQIINTIDSLNEKAFEVKRNDINKAFLIISNALNLAKTNNYTKGTATALLYQGGIYQQLGSSKRALSVFYYSLSLSRKINDTFNIARATQQVANALQETGNFVQAQKLFEEAMKIYKSLNRVDEVANIDNSLGLIKLGRKEYDEAEVYFKQALSQSSKDNYLYGHKKSLYNLGLLELEKNNLNPSQSYFEQALKLDVLKNDKYGIALAKTRLSSIAAKMGKYEESIDNATEAFKVARDISALQIEVEAVENITKAYAEQHNFRKVAEWDSVLITQHKQLYSKERIYAIEFLGILERQLTDQLLIEKQALQSQQKVKQTRVFLSIAGVALIILSIFSYFILAGYKKVKKYSKVLVKQNEVIEKNALLLNQLNEEISEQNVALEKSNQMKDKLLSVLSHDLRTPLSNTKGIINLISSGFISKEQEQDLMVKLEEQYVRSLNLLDELLLWIGSQMKGASAQLKKTELKDLFNRLIDDQKVPLENKQIDILNCIEDNLCVNGDKEMLKIIFRNLIANAIKFTRTGGCLKIHSTMSEGVDIHIEDNGVGMSEEELNKINQREYFTKTGTAKELGSGFGLRLCHDLINIQGGQLRVKSQKDIGSTFTVNLPGFN